MNHDPESATERDETCVLQKEIFSDKKYSLFQGHVPTELYDQYVVNRRTKQVHGIGCVILERAWTRVTQPSLRI